MTLVIHVCKPSPHLVSCDQYAYVNQWLIRIYVLWMCLIKSCCHNESVQIILEIYYQWSKCLYIPRVGSRCRHLNTRFSTHGLIFPHHPPLMAVQSTPPLSCSSPPRTVFGWVFGAASGGEWVGKLHSLAEIHILAQRSSSCYLSIRS